MAYTLYRFGTSYVLPTAGAEFDLTTGDARIESIAFPHGGDFDLMGSEQSFSGGYELVYKFILVGTSDADLLTKLNTLLSYKGKKDRLFRKIDSTGLLQWVWARLKSVDAYRKSDNINHLNIELKFYVFSPLWNGERKGVWRLDDGFVLDTPDLHLDTGLNFQLETTETNINVTNSGNAKLHSWEMAFTASGSPITSIRIQKEGETDFTWTGNLAIGSQLTIDFGSLSIRNSGVDAYSGLQLSGANHKIDSWAVLNPGTNTFTITRTGGDSSSSVSVAYYDGWM